MDLIVNENISNKNNINSLIKLNLINSRIKFYDKFDLDIILSLSSHILNCNCIYFEKQPKNKDKDPIFNIFYCLVNLKYKNKN